MKKCREQIYRIITEDFDWEYNAYEFYIKRGANLFTINLLKPVNVNIDIRMKDPPEGFNAQLLLPFFDDLLVLCLRFIDLPEGSLDTLVIADPENFGAAVYEYQDETGHTRRYTDRGHYQAVGKTIPKRMPDETVTSTVIINMQIMDRLIEEFEGGAPYEDWDPQSRLWLYLIVHELGHCKDNYLTRSCEDNPFNFEDEFSVRAVAKYNVFILLSEFTACVLSARAAGPDVQQHMIDEWHQSMTELLDAIENQRTDYVSGYIGLRQLADSVAHSFWAFTVQYAKLVGHSIGNSDAMPASEWNGARPEISELLKDLAAELRRLWDKYPSWPDESEIINRLLPFWHRFTEAYGYHFTENEKGSELYLR